MELNDDDVNDADFAIVAGDKDSSSEEDFEEKIARLVRLLTGVVRTNENYSLGGGMVHLDANVAALATFGAVELQVQTFFASCSVVRAGGFTKVDPSICIRCLRWNLTAPFSRCNRDSWTSCGRCSYIQHARCKDVRKLDPSRPPYALPT
jgi:hypothetical protein